METNALYYGDNLDILRRYIPDESVDLVYLDPPFNSNRDYNVIFRDESGASSDAQILAFEDTWHWGPSVAETYSYLTNTSLHHGKVPESVSDIVGALRQGIGTNQMLAYIVEMTVRLVELQRILKPTGSFYLHCDPAASHYLKLVADAVFGPDSFRNEIVWKRTSAHGNASRRYASVHDLLLFYSKGRKWTWNQQYEPYSQDYIDEHFVHLDPDGRRFRRVDMRNPAYRPNLVYDYKGYKPHPNGWLVTKDEMERLDRENRLFYPKKGETGRIRRKLYLDESPGVPVTDVWADIKPIFATGAERLGWETQKPLPLLERLIAASSNPGDIVLDPFCGCGTALVASHMLGRAWVGIDVTHLSIAVMRARLRDAFPKLGEVKVIGQPTEVEGARMLAAQSLEGRYEFQYWALSLVDAQPSGERKKGADSGIDGRITFTDTGGQVRPVLVSVKSGGVNVPQIRDLVGTMQREGAPLGLFVTLEEPSKPMLVEAAGAGTYRSELANRDYPKVQILTIRELLDGRKPQLPLLVMPTYQQAEKVEQESPGQEKLFG